MYYSITIKLPKSKIQQYDMPGPVSVNDLSDEEFVNLLSLYNDHMHLSRNLTKLKNVGLKEVFWEILSPQKNNVIINYYSSNPIYFADEKTNPGENNTLNQKDGYYRKSSIPDINKSNELYMNLGVNPMPFFRLHNQNYFIPNYEINLAYKIIPVKPDPQTFKLILRELIDKNIIKYPLAQKNYNYSKPDFYLLNDTYYFVPHYNELSNGKNNSLLDVYNEFSSASPIYDFTTNVEAWISFLESLPETVRSEKTYDSYIMLIEEKLISKFPGTAGKKVPIYYYDSKPYFVMSYGTIQIKSKELFDLWKTKVIDGKVIYKSLADEAFRQLKIENPFQEFITDGLQFKAFFNCKEDPRWEKFIKSKYFKIPENATEEQIRKIKEEIRIKSPRLFLFSSIKPIKVEVIDNDGKKKHCFNLSNDYFENVPDGPWKRCMSALTNNPCKIYEFAIWRDSINPEIWKGESRTPTARGDIKITPFTFEHNKGMDENRYSLDAVLVDENDNIKYIIEFDGTDHFYSREKDGNPTGKIVSDQVKNSFARQFNIPCVRIPGFQNKRELDFINDFKNYIINLIRERYNLPPINQESENINPGVYNRSLK